MESKKKVELNTPYGGELVDLLVTGSEREDLARRAGAGTTLQLTPRSLCDLELLATGGFSPLDRFIGKADYDSVLNNMRWPRADLVHSDHLAGDQAGRPSRGQELALRNANNNLIAWMRIDEIYETNPSEEAAKGLACADEEHPTYREMLSWGNFRLSGPLQGARDAPAFRFPRIAAYSRPGA